jgi:transketolase
MYPEETLGTYYCYGSPFQGHADRWCTPGIDFSGGSLGQGLSFAAGLALAEKLKMKFDPPSREDTFLPRYIVRYNPRFRTYCIMGRRDARGQIWEAACSPPNSSSITSSASSTTTSGRSTAPQRHHAIEPLVEKWKAFGWTVYEIDGGDLVRSSMRSIWWPSSMAITAQGHHRPHRQGEGLQLEELHMHLGRGEEMMKGVREGRAKYGDVE